MMPVPPVIVVGIARLTQMLRELNKGLPMTSGSSLIHFFELSLGDEQINSITNFFVIVTMVGL